jgi:Rrf2 family nitric oxide-sensitive transcriptional repressor
MHLTTFSDYTLRTLMYLALQPDKLCTVEEIAAAYGISTNHLMKVVHQAALAGDIASVRGRGGGLRLCAAGACAIQPACVLQDALREALEAFLAVLDGSRWPILSARSSAWPIC